MVDYEWDETKRLINLKLHKLDFADALEFDWESARTVQDTRYEYGEVRHIALGKFKERLTVMAFTIRGSSVRIISWRKANDREKKAYETRAQD